MVLKVGHREVRNSYIIYSQSNEAFEVMNTAMAITQVIDQLLNLATKVHFKY